MPQISLQGYGMSVNFSPQEGLRAFCPNSLGRNKKKENYAPNDCSAYTNENDMLANDGADAWYLYPVFTPFTPHDTKRYCVLCTLKGLYPFPHVSKKFNTKNKYPTDNNDAVAFNL